MKQNPADAIKDTMWTFLIDFDMTEIEANVTALKENVNRLLRMTTQETAGQRKARHDINWEEMDMTLMFIAIETTALVLSGKLDKLEAGMEAPTDGNVLGRKANQAKKVGGNGKMDRPKMTREECIKNLRGSMDLFLLDPGTGEAKTPNMLNDMDRMTYDAMEYAADFLEAHPKGEQKSSGVEIERKKKEERQMDEQRREIIAQLRDLIKDREALLDRDEPDSVFQKDIDALRWAIDFIETHPKGGQHSYFFTFGTDPEFPYGIHEYVEIHADSRSQAAEKFKIHFPCREGSDLLNCAFIYSEDEWRDKVCPENYGGKKPAMVIE